MNPIISGISGAISAHIGRRIGAIFLRKKVEDESKLFDSIKMESGEQCVCFPQSFFLRIYAYPLVFFIFILALIIAFPDTADQSGMTIEGVAFSYVSFFLLLSLSGWIALISYFLKYRLTPEGIEKISYFSKTAIIRWDEIEKISYDEILGPFITIYGKKQKFRVHLSMNGIPYLSTYIMKKIPEERWKSAHAVITRTAIVSSKSMTRKERKKLRKSIKRGNSHR
jgi:hypothetical protein